MSYIRRKSLKIVFKTGKFISWLITPGVACNYRQVRNYFYSGWLQRSFGACGKYLEIEYPAVMLGTKYMEIGNGFFSRARLRMEVYDRYLHQQFTPQLKIGDQVCFNFDCHVGCNNRIVIGNNVLIGSRVLITDHFHGEADSQAFKVPPAMRELVSRGPVVIGDNVWIGEGVAIMPNVTIGKNAVIGANAVVTRDVPENAVVAGIPAKVLRIVSID